MDTPLLRAHLRSLGVLVSTALLVIAVFAAGASPATAQSADQVFVVVNDASPVSIQVGEYYIRKRAIATDHVVHVKTSVAESISRQDYEAQIEGPVATALLASGLQDRILYIVLTKGMPLRVVGSEGREGTVASVDSELTLLYRKMLGIGVPTGGRVANPYFLGDAATALAKPFTRFVADIYLVTRLDGFTADDVLKLIDRAMTPSRDGKIVLDQRATSVVDRGGDLWLDDAGDRLKAQGAGDRVVLETTRGVAAAAGPVLGYYSWGSNDPSNKLRDPGVTFAPGAVAGLFVSTDGRTFTEPPADWAPGPSNKPLGLFGSGSQSVTGDLIRAGVTGVSGHVSEPYLDATIRPQVLFPTYLAGFTLAESFYLAMPYLSWQSIVIGDPLCTPFPRQTLTADQIAKGIDPETDLPGLFAERRLAVFARTGLKVEGVKVALKAEVANRRGDKAQVETLLVKATELEPRLVAPQMQLAGFYEARNEHDKAIERYRLVLAIEPTNAVGLNNLAYALAVNKKLPAEALPLAQKAYAVAAVPVIADTLGWVHHLLGNDREAASLLERAVVGAPGNADVLLHAAIVHAALNDRLRARAELDAAIKANPAIADQPEVKALRDRLKGSLPH